MKIMQAICLFVVVAGPLYAGSPNEKKLLEFANKAPLCQALATKTERMIAGEIDEKIKADPSLARLFKNVVPFYRTFAQAISSESQFEDAKEVKKHPKPTAVADQPVTIKKPTPQREEERRPTPQYDRNAWFHNLSKCFLSGTPIIRKTEGNNRAEISTVENVEAGDQVLGYFAHYIDHGRVRGEICWDNVSQVYERTLSETSEIRKVTLQTSDRYADAVSLYVTNLHHFFVEDETEGRWIRAQDLQLHQELFSPLGAALKIEVSDNRSFPITLDRNKVYNFTTKITHTYFIGGEAAVLVHNVK